MIVTGAGKCSDGLFKMSNFLNYIFSRLAKDFLMCIRDEPEDCKALVDDNISSFEVLLNDVCKKLESEFNTPGCPSHILDIINFNKL